MLTAAEAHTSSLGIPYLRLDCRADRPKLRALYESSGFTLVDEFTAFGWLQVVRYQKHATAP